ncbi:hypothetical protein JHK85_014176 [Glycine max]|uniref:AAA-type ATPase N-terminal domain-containing protein n=1 Tax=Glycine max TaxID=3847 RepID=A0A0R0KA58_SOYBN|nr:hypothetical protein JHK85_014176 [Glycine max]
MEGWELWSYPRSQLGTVMDNIIFVYVTYEQFLPYSVRNYIIKYVRKLTSHVHSYIHVSFPEFTGEQVLERKRSQAYIAIRTHLSVNSAQRAGRLKAEVVTDSQTLVVLGIDDNEENTFQGLTVWWSANHKSSNPSKENRFLKLTFHKQGRAIAFQDRTPKLYTDNSSSGWYTYKTNSLIESIEETKKKLLTQDEVKKANKDEKAHLKEEREKEPLAK